MSRVQMLDLPAKPQKATDRRAPCIRESDEAG